MALVPPSLPSLIWTTKSKMSAKWKWTESTTSSYIGKWNCLIQKANLDTNISGSKKKMWYDLLRKWYLLYVLRIYFAGAK